jgi:hypothetical protein
MIQTVSKTKAFWQEPAFWKDGQPKTIDQFVEELLQMHPSEGQQQILRALAGDDPYDWDLRYQQYAIAVGQGGGKNKFIIAPFTGYLAYKIANMKDPWRYFSRFYASPLDESVRFEMTNSSMVTERQARNVHFSNMSSLIKRCLLPDGRNWFEAYAGMDLRESVGDFKSKVIEIPTRLGCGSIVLHSFDSTPTAPEGLSIILGIIDEPSRADTPAGYDDAKMLWNVLKGNLNTRFGLGVGKVIAFSYLNNSQYDFTDTLLKEAEEQAKTLEHPVLFGVNRSTFEMNPNVSKSDPSIVAAYRADPIDARTRYEGVKGAPKEGFYQPHIEKVRECFFSIASPVAYESVVTERVVEDPNGMTRQVKRFRSIHLTDVQGDFRRRCWAFDAAERFDAFVLKGGYVETIDELRAELFIDNQPELVVINKRPIIDIVLMWQPTEDLPVDYLNVGEVLGTLLGKFPNSVSVSSDRYNSAKLSQEILARGIRSHTYSFSSQQQFRLYSMLRWMMWNNVPQLAADDRHSATKKGLTKTVGEWNILEHEQLLRDGHRILHPEPHGSKDLADCDALLVHDLQSLETQTGVITVSGNESLSDPKILALFEKYLVERQRQLNAGVPRSEILKKTAAAMHVPVSVVSRLQEMSEGMFCE